MSHKITNKAEFEISLCGKKHSVVSKESVVEPIRIEIEQIEPCRFCLEGENIEYVYKVKNLSHAHINDSMFKSQYCERVEFVRGSFKVNGVHQRACVHGNTIESCIKELKPCETATVSYEVKARTMSHNPCHHHGGGGDDARPPHGRPPHRPDGDRPDSGRPPHRPDHGHRPHDCSCDGARSNLMHADDVDSEQ